MAYADLATIQATDPGDPLTAAWCDQARDNDEFFRDPPAASVYNASAVSIATGATGTILDADSELFDNDSMHSTASNTSRLTVQTAGRYLFVATVQFAASATGNRRLAFRVNGTTTYESTLTAGTSGNSTVLTAPRSFVLAAADYVEVSIWQTSGGNLNVTLLEFAAVLLTLT